jgi:HEAT repeat protein
MNTTVKKLRRQMLAAQFSEDIIRLMFAIARTGEADAIPVIADQMDVPCAVGAAAVRALIEIGPAVIPEMRKRLEALDEDMVRTAHRVLGALGDERSARAAQAVCWADFEEAEMVAERRLKREAAE